jgi:hypothetical protein
MQADGGGGEGGGLGATWLLAGLAFEPRTKTPRRSIKLNHPATGLEGEFAPGALPVAGKIILCYILLYIYIYIYYIFYYFICLRCPPSCWQDYFMLYFIIIIYIIYIYIFIILFASVALPVAGKKNSKVSASVNSLYKTNMQSTYENFPSEAPADAARNRRF